MHSTLRKDKECLNCGKFVFKKYCTHCGQENTEINDSVTHLIVHYFQDLVHFDGKFFTTIRSLFLRPGQVAQAYLMGKRMRFLKPIQFYVFASTVFFIVFFMFKSTNENQIAYEKNYARRLFSLQNEKTFFKNTITASYADSLIVAVKKLYVKDSALKSSNGFITFDPSNDTNLKKSDMNWLEKRISEKERNFDGDKESLSKYVTEKAFHKLPQLLFVSLPIFAFFLWLAHRRKTKKTYVSNFIFSIYHYSYVFVILFLSIVLASTTDRLFSEQVAQYILGGISVLTITYLSIYLILSMRKFYAQSLFKAIIKAIVVAFSTMIVTLLLFALLLVFILAY